MNFRFAMVAFLGVAVLVGCRQGWEADYSGLDLVEVSGRITLDGSPLAKAHVVFENPDATFSYGTTDEQGNYSLMFNSEKSGIAPGPKVVRIRTSGSGGEGEDAPSEGADGTMPAVKEALPDTYHSKSQLKATVEGTSQVLNFDLKSDGSVTGPTG